jgi:hypothetical protein
MNYFDIGGDTYFGGTLIFTLVKAAPTISPEIPSGTLRTWNTAAMVAAVSR